MPTFLRLPGLLAVAMTASTDGCTDRVIVEEDPLGGFTSEEAMCRQYCEVISTCGYYNRGTCLDECIRPHDKWPWLTAECLDLRREAFVCVASYDTCDEYDRRTREGDPCVDELYNWEAAGYECFGQYDYGEHSPDCNTHGALVYIDGFEHSPFACSYECCHEDLRRAAIVYHVILNNFIGLMPPYDGEPYAAIEPDQPCE